MLLYHAMQTMAKKLPSHFYIVHMTKLFSLLLYDSRSNGILFKSFKLLSECYITILEFVYYYLLFLKNVKAPHSE